MQSGPWKHEATSSQMCSALLNSSGGHGEQCFLACLLSITTLSLVYELVLLLFIANSSTFPPPRFWPLFFNKIPTSCEQN